MKNKTNNQKHKENQNKSLQQDQFKNNNKHNGSNKKIIIAFIAIVAIVTIATIALTTSLNKNKNNVEEFEERIITIPLNELSTTAQFYEEEIDGVAVKFFAVKDDEGNVKTAFDACDVCFNSKKGYTQQGDYVVCNNCGNKYHISGLGTENKAKGGCWPSYLPSETEDENLIINLSDIAQGKYKFK